MTQFKNRVEEATSEELTEFPLRGPFGGIQSEMPPDSIEGIGFLDVQNMICIDSALVVRPGWTGLTAMPDPQEPILGEADFFDKNGVRHQVIFTPTRVLAWNGAASTWTVLTGGPLTGPATQTFEWAVVNYKLLFSQGTDKVQLWDGITAGFTPAAATAVPAFAMFEIDFQLVVAGTVEAGQYFPQRVRWTGPGDPTDWTSLNAGIEDLLNDLGPIHHGVKLYQQGYFIQHFGITQMVPTGQAANPFTFTPLASNNQGCAYPHSPAHQGGEFVCYAGLDNIYKFDGTYCTPIGDMPIDGRGHKIGARDRILSDLSVSDPNTVFGYITNNVGASYLNAYWLVIPGISTWIFHFEEQSWTRFSFAKKLDTVGRFTKSGIPRIIDLIGPISIQSWSPATLIATSPLDGVLLGFDDGTPGYVDFSVPSERPWLVASGQHVFADLRHQKTVKKFRVVIEDLGQVQFTITVSGVVYPNPKAQLDGNGVPISTNSNVITQSQIVTMGNGSGQAISRVVEFTVPGNYITWQITGAANQRGSFVEFTPIYSIGGEQRGA